MAFALLVVGVGSYLWLTSQPENIERGLTVTTSSGGVSVTTSSPTTDVPSTATTTTTPAATTISTPPVPAGGCDLACTTATERVSNLFDEAVAGGTFGFMLKEVGGEIGAEHNSASPFYPASAIKVVHLVHALRSAPPGDLDGYLDSQIPVYSNSCVGEGSHSFASIRSLLALMMVASDNGATNAIQDHFGLDALNATMADASMSASAIHHRFGCGGPDNNPANTATASDFVRLYEGVADGFMLPDPDGLAAFYSLILDVADLAVTPIGGGQAHELGGEGVTHVYVKEGWYGTILTAGGVIDLSGGGVWVYAAFVSEADRVSPDFDIKQVVAELISIAVDRSRISG